jgi:glycine dehydrogenase
MSPDNTIYPLGSCTMKYNPYLNDYVANFSGFTNSHPNDDLVNTQGSLEVLFQIQEYFKEITGLPAVTTQPVAGAQGELVGLKMFQAYHNEKGEVRDVVLIPKSAHGTNPATATYAGFDAKNGIVLINALPTGTIDFSHLEELVEEYSSRICGIMITNPNTSGLFEKDFKKIADLIHVVGGLVYMDGANMNAIAGWVNLQKMGVDAVHNNLHKTWSIPHGGGGPGDAVVAVSDKLVDYLPGFQVVKTEKGFVTEKSSKSIGSFHRDYGNFVHKVRCLTYLKALGADGIKQMSAVAVLAARYLSEKLNKHSDTLPNSYETPIMHEFILTFSKTDFGVLEAKTGLSKVKIISQFGKLFLDYGYHAPTVAFPEVLGLMIEPTESYAKQELDDFVNTVIQMKKDVFENPTILINAPSKAPIAKVDEVEANRKLKLSEKLTRLPELP